ncbi:UDP-glucose 4-epimerase GalE [Ruania halotolerans]|uniref:UDP-glucose 4-epimerase GalE n=1 Tax=Ruania halotolerans TaxID=2897773 RepID=UPI001E637F3D|nr:UDP-glucose 4-epimerase GalE [Ruania halotolerans]UFU05714.1 UDP-glucose 4-epimerase GalE [Ruania halotolerans]
MKVLLTGGAGFLGSITATALLRAGHVPVVLDSLVSGPREFTRDRIFYEGDVGDRALVRRIIAEHPEIEVTVHMAARTSVPESVGEPGLYYRENVVKTLDLLEELITLDRPRVVFSSSAAVYAPSADEEVTEASPVAPGSPYGRTKLMVEQLLTDLSIATRLRAVILRYFNPVGSDPDLRSGVHAAEPTHVLGQLIRTARGEQEVFTLTGTDYPTRDGTGLRDYVHAWDLARSHVRAVERFDQALDAVGTPSLVINVGTGGGVTVRELHAATERVTGRPIPMREAPARPGDATGAYANVERARELLGWEAELTLDEAIRSSLAWAVRRDDLLGRR